MSKRLTIEARLYESIVHKLCTCLADEVCANLAKLDAGEELCYEYGKLIKPRNIRSFYHLGRALNVYFTCFLPKFIAFKIHACLNQTP